MKKKCTPFLFFVLSFSTFVHAQRQAHTNPPIDSRLYEVYDGGFLDHLKSDNPFLLQRLNFYLDHAWYLTDLPAEKDSAGYRTITVADLENINILKIEKEQHLAHNWERQTVYKIANTSQALVFYSGKEFTRQLNEHLGRSTK
ncbi:MAG: hypothetical protein ACE5FF_06895 [Saprospiraceae bacterium]